MDYIDLHTHTTFSDGTYTPKELIEYAAQKGLKAIAVTDHDTVESYESSAFWAKHYNIELIPGVEIEADYEGIEVHILGLFIDPKNKALLELLDNLQQIRKDRDNRIIEILNKDGINVKIEDIQALSGVQATNRPLFAKYLVMNGYYDSISDAMINYLGHGKRAYVEKSALPKPSIIFDIIKRAGGISILAHPIQYGLDYFREEDMIKELKACGLVGLEAIYSENDPEDTRRYLEMAKRFSLIVSGGSDFHGSVKPGLDLGCGRGDFGVCYEVLDGLRGYLQTRF